MNSALRNGVIATAGIALAIAAGWQIANEELMLIGLTAGLLVLWLVGHLTGIRTDVLLAGVLLIGYLVGNRGFAQISLPHLPVLAGELTLAVGLIVAAWQAARTKVSPVRRDALNFMLLAWLSYGAVRLYFDLNVHGVVALRDFALIYYSLFFFLAQTWGSHPEQRRWLERSLDLAFSLAPPVFIGFVHWPDFFIKNFTLGGVPVILIKSDVESGLLVAGALWFLYRNATASHRWWLFPAAANLVAMADGNSRAGLIALAATMGWLLVCLDRHILRPLVLILAAGLLAITSASALLPAPWEQTPAHRLYEWSVSVIDVQGVRLYASSDLNDKPDNNRFRMAWWRNVIERTMNESPWFGLGFGYDLAQDFRRDYYGDIISEEFSARSPHNFILTVFGRMGFAGVALLASVMAGMAAIVWRHRSRGTDGQQDYQRFALGLGAWGILVSACFGVVLEGPMGAVVFWILLGLANATLPTRHEMTLPAPNPTGIACGT